MLLEKINIYKLDGEKFNIKVIEIDINFMNFLPMWKTLKKEEQVINSIYFKNIIGNRSIYPEHSYPEYTLINHCKIDLICSLINSKKLEYEYFFSQNKLSD